MCSTLHQIKSSTHTLLSGTPAPTTSTRPQPLLQSFLWRGWREQGAQTDGRISEEGIKANTRTMGMKGMNELKGWSSQTMNIQINKTTTATNTTTLKVQIWRMAVIWRGRVVVGWCIFPIKQSIHNLMVTGNINSMWVCVSSAVWHLLAVCDAVMTKKERHTECCDEHMGVFLSLYPHFIDQLF